jgi:hypothetical protein
VVRAIRVPQPPALLTLTIQFSSSNYSSPSFPSAIDSNPFPSDVTDPYSRAVMRIVANWGANLTPEELKKFQSHIDELTRMQQERQAAAEASHTVYEQTKAIRLRDLQLQLPPLITPLLEHDGHWQFPSKSNLDTLTILIKNEKEAQR